MSLYNLCRRTGSPILYHLINDSLYFRCFPSAKRLIFVIPSHCYYRSVIWLHFFFKKNTHRVSFIFYFDLDIKNGALLPLPFSHGVFLSSEACAYGPRSFSTCIFYFYFSLYYTCYCVRVLSRLVQHSGDVDNIIDNNKNINNSHFFHIFFYYCGHTGNNIYINIQCNQNFVLQWYWKKRRRSIMYL